MLVALLITLSLLCGTAPASAATFTYDDQAAWSSLSATCGNGTRQSPIDILTADTVYNPVAGDLDYTTPGVVFGRISNNGHTLQYTLDADSALATYASKVLSDTANKFELKQLHFHWGTTAADGSEHLVDGTAYPLEVHLVHLNEKYDTIADGAAQADGLAVIGLFFEETAQPTLGNTALRSISEYAKTGNSAEFMDGVTTENIPLNINSLLDQSQILSTKRFYTYEGSLTTPGCNEAVQWIVAEGVGKVCTATMEAIRMARHAAAAPAPVRRDADGIAPNFREPQPLNGRTVTASFDGDATGNNGDNSASVNGAACWMLAMSAVLVALVA